MGADALTSALPAGDGCTGWFDGVWRHCCDAHDIAYRLQLDKFRADLDLAACVAGTGHPFVAVAMLLGVSIFGWFFYLRARARKLRSLE